MDTSEKVAIVKNAIGSYDDFPKPGIVFKDIFGIFRDVNATKVLLELLIEHITPLKVDAIVGLDARGFLVGPLIAVELGKPFIPIRKKGKLPGRVVARTYKLEYGEDTIEMQESDHSRGKRVLIIDDLLATGGTMEAAIQLLKSAEAEVVECLAIIELVALKGRSQLTAPVHSIVQF